MQKQASDDLRHELSFQLDYHRKKQMERLDTHVKDGGSINSFFASHAEYSVDSVLHSLGLYLDALNNEKIATDNRQFWFHFTAK